MAAIGDVKPIPNEPDPISAMDADRANDANLAPQGKVNLEDEAPDAVFTPEGDEEQVPHIQRSKTDPA
jgi:hypothetical protein